MNITATKDYYNETVETLEKRILLDKQVAKFVDKEALASFMLEHIDPNALMCMERIAFVYKTENDPSRVRKKLEDYTDALLQSDKPLTIIPVCGKNEKVYEKFIFDLFSGIDGLPINVCWLC